MSRMTEAGQAMVDALAAKIAASGLVKPGHEHSLAASIVHGVATAPSTPSELLVLAAVARVSHTIADGEVGSAEVYALGVQLGDLVLNTSLERGPALTTYASASRDGSKPS